MSAPFIGQISMFAGNFPPLGWAFCNGQTLAITQYDSLFNLIGTTYGGDGQTTFQLPNLAGRIPLHQGGGFVIGQSDGVETVTLTSNQIPSHTHLLNASTAATTETGPAGHVTGDATAATAKIYGAPVTAAPFASGAIGSAGNSTAHANLMPYLAVSFIIALEGIFPSQS